MTQDSWYLPSVLPIKSVDSDSLSFSHTMSLVKDDTIERAARGDGSDEALFNPRPPCPDCPICWEPMPADARSTTYKPCCGRLLCFECYRGHIQEQKEAIPHHLRTKSNRPSCPFCDAPGASSKKEDMKRLAKRAELNDHRALHQLAQYCSNDPIKAMSLYHKAASIGSVDAHYLLSFLWQQRY